MPFLIIFVVIPLIELFLFAALSDVIGLFTALLFALFTAVLGGSLVKQQGIQTLLSLQNRMDKGQMPLNEIFDGLCLVSAGALLITPGFLTDGIGFALLVPKFRQFLRYVIKEHTNWATQSGTFTRNSSNDDDIIDGEYKNLDDDENRLR